MNARKIVIIGAYAALLLGSQLVLSGVAGVEVVTALFAAFAFSFGIVEGVVLGVAFSWLRCLLFGFFPNVVILYLVYYPLFAVGFGLLGRGRAKYTVKIHVFAVLLAVFFAAAFTAIDNLVTPLYYGYSRTLFRLYHTASVPVVISQTICAGITVGLLFPPLVKVLAHFRGRMDGESKNAWKEG